MNKVFAFATASTIALLPASASGFSHVGGSTIGGGNGIGGNVNVPSGLGNVPSANIPNQNSIGNVGQSTNSGSSSNTPSGQGQGGQTGAVGQTSSLGSLNAQPQTSSGSSNGTRSRGGNRAGTPVLNPGLSALSADATDEVSQRIAIANEICSWFPLDVRVDCIADRFLAIAQTIPADGEYAPVRAALEEAAADLRGISNKYSGQSATAKRFQAPHPQDGSPVKTSRLTFVEPSLQQNAFQEALQVVDELETKLLRSSENSRKRQVHYQEISAAIGSTKLLLRSA